MGKDSGLVPPAADGEADVVLFNARIYTSDDALPFAEAMAFRGDRLTFVGSNRQLLQAYPLARRLDMGRLTIVPGFVDAHVHLMAVGRSTCEIDLRGAASVEEVTERVAAGRTADSSWLVGSGWDQNRWPGTTMPRAVDLDMVEPDRPVWLRRIDRHAGWANSAALRAAGITAETPDPQGGLISRDASGAPTGILLDTAMTLVESALPGPTQSEEDRALRTAIQEMHAAGITAVHDAGTDLATIQRCLKAAADGHLDLRVCAMAEGHSDAHAYLCEHGIVKGAGGRLSARAVKFYMDGALGSRGAALLEAYADDPGNHGLLRYERQAFEEEIRRAAGHGLQVCTHAIGDAANRLVLDAYAAALDQDQLMQGRHRIEHAQVVHPGDIERFASQNVIASVQPSHAESDRAWAAARLGAERLTGAYAWRALADAGARLAFGSDAPIEPIDPLRGLQAALTGTGPGTDEGLTVARRLDRETALRAYTRDAAYAGFQEEQIGTITAGKQADFVVLSDDLMRVPVEELGTIRVVATFFGGRRVFGGW